MIEFYSSPTPNGWKVAMALEELELDYQLKLVDLSKGEQHSDEFLAMNPNGRIPVIRDTDTGVCVFESGAILI